MFPRTETLSAWLDIDSRCYPPMTSWYYTAVAQTISPYRPAMIIVEHCPQPRTQSKGRFDCGFSAKR